MYPKEPPVEGSAPQTFKGTNITYIWRTIADGHWIVDGPPGVQTEIRRSTVFDGAYDLLQTNGGAPRVGVLTDWGDLREYFH